jgi:hypothetical protein
MLLTACGDGADTSASGGVTIEPLPSRTVAAKATVALGGKRAQPLTTVTTAEAEIESPDTAVPAPAVTATLEPAVATAPTSGRWIDVDVTNYAVRLMDGERVVREIAPVGVGVAIDTGAYVSTQTGLFHVHTKTEALVYDAPYDTYISHWVGFDAEKDNGFHSFLKDAAGAVVDPSTGRVSNGCIRTGEPDAVFAYAEIGMPVWVHW